MCSPNIVAYKSRNIGSIPFVDHAFFSRVGGVSNGDYKSLNLGFNTGDALENVEKNRDIVVNHFKEASCLITLHQVSGTNVKMITNSTSKNDCKSSADALITKSTGIIIGILTADCAPILLVDPTSKIVAAIHAGHSGAFGGIIKNTTKQMEAIGANLETTIAAIGPTIQQQSYEVQIDFYKRFIAEDRNNKSFFSNNPSGGYYFNLPAYVKQKLQNAGIFNIEVSELDTYSNPSLFFSHRYSTKLKINRGVQISTIMIRP